MSKIILASSSNFKSSLLKKAAIDHVCMESNFVEKSDKTNMFEWVEDIAYGKAKEVADRTSDDCIIIGVDTVVYYNWKIYTKPNSLEEAYNNMKELNGKTSSVITGVCVINKENGKILKDYSETLVTLNHMTDDEINFYLNNEKNILNASGYIVENILSRHIKKIEGSYVNILGMPNETIYNLLKRIK